LDTRLQPCASLRKKAVAAHIVPFPPTLAS
jgi:hypothetical protein